MPAVATRSEITLGILAGGRASRLGGIDKAWLQRGGTGQVLRWRDRFADEVGGGVLVSTNRGPDRYSAHGLVPIADRHATLAGPAAGLDALAAACSTAWLFTIPVDLIDADGCLLSRLLGEAGPDGAYAVDDDGRQPLVSIWRIAALRAGLVLAAAAGEAAVHALQRRLAMPPVRFDGVRFGNLNTFADLAAAGASSE